MTVTRIKTHLALILVLLLFSGCSSGTADQTGLAPAASTPSESTAAGAPMASGSGAEATSTASASASTATTVSATASAAASAPSASAPSRILRETVEFPSLANNKVGDDGKKQVVIYLPPSYHTEPERRFPVVYFLHGYGNGPGDAIAQSRDFDTRMLEPGQKEFLVVEASGDGPLGGSFFVNSPLTGNWEDAFSQDLTGWVDKTFRTIAKRNARGISGFSMGGYGCLNLALSHPDLYGSVYAVSPGLMRDGKMKEAFPMWETAFQVAYGSAFSPDMTAIPPKEQIPVFDGTNGDKEVLARWYGGFGDLSGKMDRYQAKGQPLNGIRIAVGTGDGYAWIPDGCHALSDLMFDRKIPHELDLFNGGHTLPLRFGQDFVTFFSRALREK